MRQCGIALSQFFFKGIKCFLRLAVPSNDPKCPIRNFFTARIPFVRPGKKNRPCKTAFYYAVDMPPEHVGLLVLRMPDCVHAEFPEDKRMLASEILQSEQVAFEIALIVKVNIETAKIGILRQQIFGRRISGIRK